MTLYMKHLVRCPAYAQSSINGAATIFASFNKDQLSVRYVPDLC